MNVFNITGAQGPKGPHEKGGVDRSSAASRGDKAGKTAPTGDSFAQSEKAAEVESLVDQLASGDGLRAELVDKFKALMELGQLDSPEAAEKAAEAILADAPDMPPA